MKHLFKIICSSLIFIFLTSICIYSQAISGTVLTLSGQPIVGAEVKLVTANKTTTTDNNGYYDFANSEIHNFIEKLDYSMTFGNNQIILDLTSNNKVSIDLYNLSGRLVTSIINKNLQKGNHCIQVNDFNNKSQQIYIIKIQIGNNANFHKIANLKGNITFLSKKYSQSQQLNLSYAPTADSIADTIIVTHPEYHGSFFDMHTRGISELSGKHHFRMIASDTVGWYAPPMEFNFLPHHDGVDKFKDSVPDWVATESEVHRQILQSIYKEASSIPEDKKFEIFKCNIHDSMETITVASTWGNNNLGFNPVYINKPEVDLQEILGVLLHECVHSYQPYFIQTGVGFSFGEAICDAIRAMLGGYPRKNWSKGSKCRGGIDQYYQAGGRYWLYIELKHPGFISFLFEDPENEDVDINELIQAFTGESLDDLCEECEQDGLPYDLH